MVQQYTNWYTTWWAQKNVPAKKERYSIDKFIQLMCFFPLFGGKRVARNVGDLSGVTRTDAVERPHSLNPDDYFGSLPENNGDAFHEEMYGQVKSEAESTGRVISRTRSEMIRNQALSDYVTTSSSEKVDAIVGTATQLYGVDPNLQEALHGVESPLVKSETTALLTPKSSPTNRSQKTNETAVDRNLTQKKNSYNSVDDMEEKKD